MIKVQIGTIKDLSKFISENISLLTSVPVLLLEGNMGAGKTAFVKEMMKIMSYSEEVSSPTFSLINEYIINSSEYLFKKVIHADLYRLKDGDELFETGLWEYIGSNETLCIIEWPRYLIPIIDIDFILVEIEQMESGQRELCLYNSTELHEY